MSLPLTIQAACEQLRSGHAGDGKDFRKLVQSFQAESGGDAHRRLAWLAMFAARRALPCWELYCDRDQPLRAVAVVRDWLVTGRAPGDWSSFTTEALPSFRGRRIVDCRECDTACAADAAAAAARLASNGDVTHADTALGAADGAFNQSPLGARDQFRRWLVEIAVPAAWESREMSPEEQTAFRDFDEEEVRSHRERGSQSRVIQPRALVARLGLVSFTIAIVLLHLLSPEIDPVAQGISHYVFGKFGWLLTAGFVGLGIGSMALILLLWRSRLTVWGIIGLILVATWTTLIEAGSFFSMDPPGSVPTISGRIHSLAGLGFLLLPPAALLIEWSRSTVGSPQRGRVFGIIFACGVLVASGLLFTFNGFLLNLGIGGAVQRAYWLVIVAWLWFLVQRGAQDSSHQP